MKKNLKVIIFSIITTFSYSQENSYVLSLETAITSCIENSLSSKQLAREIENEKLAFRQVDAANGITLKGLGGINHSGTPPGMESRPLHYDTENIQTGLAFGTSSTKVSVSELVDLEQNHWDNPQTTLNFTIEQNIWDGFLFNGKAQATVNQARLKYQAKFFDYEANRKALLYQVHEAFLLVLHYQRVLGLQTETVAKRNEERERTAAYLAIGRVTDLDMRQADLDRDASFMELAYARAQLGLEKKKLLLLTGLAIKSDFLVSDTPEPVSPDMNFEQALKKAYENRYELKQVDLHLAMAGIQARLTESESSVIVSAKVEIGWNRSWQDQKDSGSFLAGLNISLPFFDSGLADANRKAVQNQLEIVKLKKEQILQTIAIDVQNALIELNNKYGGLELARRNREQLIARRDLAEARFQQGLISRIEVLDANLRLTSGEVDLLTARNNYQLAVLKLGQAIGD